MNAAENGLSGWNCSGGHPNISVCTPWYGLECRQGKVVSISLSGKSLSGTIPSAIGLLRTVSYLDLSSNSIRGSIPSTVGLLSQLNYLNVQQNELTGSLPATLGMLSLLETMALSYNAFTGSFPTPVGTWSNLKALYLSSTLLTGSLPLEICESGLKNLSVTSTIKCYPPCFTVTFPMLSSYECIDSVDGMLFH